MLLKRTRSRRRDREPLPSLFDRHPDALSASRHPRGVREVPIDAIVGTARHPTQNTADFLPLPSLRGRNWEARWLRIVQATERLAVLPPVELLQVGDEYWVVDGHNRIAAGRRVGAAAVDADVTELLIPGVAATGHDSSVGLMMVADGVRQAGEGRLTGRVGIRPPELPREALARAAQQREAERVAADDAEADDRALGEAGDAPAEDER